MKGSALTRALPTEPVVVGHRGRGRSFAPLNPPTHALVENTRASFVSAHDAGAAWVELDVVAAADGTPFLWHNHFVGSTPVHRVPAGRFDELGVERFDGLSEDLPAGLGVDVEIKPLPVTGAAGRHGQDAILDLVVDLARRRPVLLSSFDPAVAAAGLAAGLAAAWITRRGYPLHEVVMVAANLGLDAVVVHGTTLEEGDPLDVTLGWQVAADAGVAVWCWDPSLHQIATVARTGVTGICTDHVPEAVEILTAPEPNR